MCGIAGKLAPGEKIEVSLLHWMCEALRHRGPDSRGTFLDDGAGLAVQRLAVIDLEHGQQPWVDPYSFRPEAEQANPAWWPYGLPYWPLVRIFGPVLAWNLFVLFTFVAAPR